MSARSQVALRGAPAWIFLLFSAVLATLLALGTLLVERRAVSVAPGKGRFNSDRLAAAAPKPPATPPAVEPAAAPKAPAQAEAATPARAAASLLPAEEPPRPVAPDATLGSPVKPPVDSQYGKVVRGQVVFEGFAFLLPPGDWRVAADIPRVSGGDLALVRESGKLVGAFAFITSQAEASGLGFAKGNFCSRPALRGVTDKNEDFGEQMCWSAGMGIARTILENQKKTTLGRAVRGDVDSRGLALPGEMVIDTVVVLGNRRRRVMMQVVYNPAADGFTPRQIERSDESDWHPKNLSQHPDKAAYVRERLLWGSQAYQQMKASFLELK
jgi:hypothetical protein